MANAHYSTQIFPRLKTLHLRGICIPLLILIFTLLHANASNQNNIFPDFFRRSSSYDQGKKYSARNKTRASKLTVLKGKNLNKNKSPAIQFCKRMNCEVATIQKTQPTAQPYYQHISDAPTLLEESSILCSRCVNRPIEICDSFKDAPRNETILFKSTLEATKRAPNQCLNHLPAPSPVFLEKKIETNELFPNLSADIPNISLLEISEGASTLVIQPGINRASASNINNKDSTQLKGNLVGSAPPAKGKHKNDFPSTSSFKSNENNNTPRERRQILGQQIFPKKSFVPPVVKNLPPRIPLISPPPNMNQSKAIWRIKKNWDDQDYSSNKTAQYYNKAECGTTLGHKSFVKIEIAIAWNDPHIPTSPLTRENNIVATNFLEQSTEDSTNEDNQGIADETVGIQNHDINPQKFSLSEEQAYEYKLSPSKDLKQEISHAKNVATGINFPESKMVGLQKNTSENRRQIPWKTPHQIPQGQLQISTEERFSTAARSKVESGKRVGASPEFKPDKLYPPVNTNEVARKLSLNRDRHTEKSFVDSLHAANARYGSHLPDHSKEFKTDQEETAHAPSSLLQSNSSWRAQKIIQKDGSRRNLRNEPQAHYDTSGYRNAKDTLSEGGDTGPESERGVDFLEIDQKEPLRYYQDKEAASTSEGAPKRKGYYNSALLTENVGRGDEQALDSEYTVHGGKSGIARRTTSINRETSGEQKSTSAQAAPRGYRYRDNGTQTTSRDAATQTDAIDFQRPETRRDSASSSKDLFSEGDHEPEILSWNTLKADMGWLPESHSIENEKEVMPNQNDELNNVITKPKRHKKIQCKSASCIQNKRSGGAVSNRPPIAKDENMKRQAPPLPALPPASTRIRSSKLPSINTRSKDYQMSKQDRHATLPKTIVGYNDMASSPLEGSQSPQRIPLGAQIKNISRKRRWSELDLPSFPLSSTEAMGSTTHMHKTLPRVHSWSPGIMGRKKFGRQILDPRNQSFHYSGGLRQQGSTPSDTESSAGGDTFLPYELSDISTANSVFSPLRQSTSRDEQRTINNKPKNVGRRSAMGAAWTRLSKIFPKSWKKSNQNTTLANEIKLEASPVIEVAYSVHFEAQQYCTKEIRWKGSILNDSVLYFSSTFSIPGGAWLTPNLKDLMKDAVIIVTNCHSPYASFTTWEEFSTCARLSCVSPSHEKIQSSRKDSSTTTTGVMEFLLDSNVT